MSNKTITEMSEKSMTRYYKLIENLYENNPVILVGFVWVLSFITGVLTTYLVMR